MKIGSKKFTESVILGEMISMLVGDAGIPATHYRELGGTQLVFQALRNGDIDIYPEYSGTIRSEILAGRAMADDAEVAEALREMSVSISRPLGFDNSYALGMKKSRASELGITRVSDLVRFPDLVFGFSNEFIDREDGWRNLQREYELPQREVSGLDHDLAYRQLRLDALDVIDLYTTDAKIELYDLAILEDDRGYFDRYEALLLYRSDLASRFPDVVDSVRRLEGQISRAVIMSANGRVEFDGISEPRVAAEFVSTRFGVAMEFDEETPAERVWSRTLEHLDLVRRSLIPAILIAIALGIWAAKSPRTGQIILAAVSIVQTIPALALLVLLMPPIAFLGLASVGLGSATAVTALFLYSLLPIVRNTHAGLNDIAQELRESAAALGLPAGYRLVRVELPLAASSILAGIKTAAVINVGFATLGALIGAGGFGQPIITGIRLNDTALILQGAIPAAVLALLMQGGFELAERYCVPRGLRIGSAE
ncbi:MAG: glycine betaine ABC transporter substrate-binding protein [Myxococcota bacterium]